MSEQDRGVAAAPLVAGAPNRMYQIGNTVWYATWDCTQNYVTCPDCGGTGRLRVIFHDETQVSIACANCSTGFNPPTGRVKVYDRRAKAERMEIVGVSLRNGSEPEYSIRGRYDYYSKADRLFDDEASALAYATVEAAKEDQAERDKVNRKHKDTRTWAWNASYHRNQIKEGERRLEYHRKALAVATVKAKQDHSEKAAGQPPLGGHTQDKE